MKLFTAGLLLSLTTAGPLAAQQSPATRDLRALQGDWTMVSATMGGATYEDIDGTRHVAGDTTTITVNGQLLMRARFILDPTVTPAAIDYDVLEGATAGKHQMGIYQLKDSTLTFCMASPDIPRPTEFTTTEGDGRTCSEWKRKGP